MTGGQDAGAMATISSNLLYLSDEQVRVRVGHTPSAPPPWQDSSDNDELDSADDASVPGDYRHIDDVIPEPRPPCQRVRLLGASAHWALPSVPPTPATPSSSRFSRSSRRWALYGMMCTLWDASVSGYIYTGLVAAWGHQQLYWHRPSPSSLDRLPLSWKRPLTSESSLFRRSSCQCLRVNRRDWPPWSGPDSDLCGCGLLRTWTQWRCSSGEAMRSPSGLHLEVSPVCEGVCEVQVLSQVTEEASLGREEEEEEAVTLWRVGERL